MRPPREGSKGGTPHPAAHVYDTHPGARRGPPDTSARASSAWPHALITHYRLGVFIPRRCPLACRALGAHAAWYRALSPSTSGPGLPSALWPRGRSLLPGSLQKLYHQPASPAPESHNHSCAWAWCSRHCRDACAGSPSCLRPLPCPAVSLTGPPDPARASYPCRRRWLFTPRFLGWWGRPSSPGTPSPLAVTPEVSFPWVSSSTPGVSMPCGN